MKNAFDVLILLVGSNPLPNFIVANYLSIKERSDEEKKKLPVFNRILFVFSEKTLKFKDSIVSQLKLEKEEVLYVNLEDRVRDFHVIKDKVSKVLSSLSINSIHLNYTGGTKPMAVAVSFAVEGLQLNEGVSKIYSDLSPEDFKLTLRNGDKFPVKGDISNKVFISIEDLYLLHSLDSPKSKEKLFTEKEDFFVFLYNEVIRYKNSKKDEEGKKFLDAWDKNSKKSELKDEMLQPIEEFIEKKDKTEYKNKEFNKLRNFIRGGWLEEYLFFVMKENKKVLKISDLKWSVEVMVEGRPFEVDLIAMKGFRSYVFSCTTEDRLRGMKSKAFEALYRARQLGGEHSKVILVCFSNKKDVNELKQDMKQFDAERDFHVFGDDDLKSYETVLDKLKEIFE